MEIEDAVTSSEYMASNIMMNELNLRKNIERNGYNSPVFAWRIRGNEEQSVRIASFRIKI
jgi:hypothetical protein